MAKKTLLSENQIASFMKLANIKSDKIQNFKKVLKEEYTQESNRTKKAQTRL